MPLPVRKNFYACLIVLLAGLQTLSATYFLHLKSFYTFNSILFLLCGTGISICLSRVPSLRITSKAIFNRQLVLKLLVFLICLSFSYHFAKRILDGTPLNFEYADMLPIIGVMCRRFLQGDWTEVYQPIPEIWNGIQPIYLPAMWLPFSVSFLLDSDMRWITVCGIWLSILLCILPKWKAGFLMAFHVASLFVLLVWLHFEQTNNVIRLTEEGVVFFYYSLMALALISGNAWLIGATAALCLLSRYAIIGWLPFAVLYLLMTKQFSSLFKSLTAGIAVAPLLIFPFGWRSLLFHLQLPQQYISQAQRVWKENPEYFNYSPGMAKFFAPDHLPLLHYCLTAGSFLVPIVFLLFVRKKKSSANILLAGFQLTITFFYSFLDVSYVYLFYTPVLVSLVIAGWTMSNTNWTLN